MSNPHVIRISKRLHDQVSQVVKRLTAEVTAELVEANPVLTGWSRSNWIPNIGAAPATTYMDEDLTKTRGSRLDSTAVDAGVAIITSSYSILNGVVTIQNNVPYISLLNDFHPVKVGFVQESIDRAVNNVVARSAQLVRG